MSALCSTELGVGTTPQLIYSAVHQKMLGISKHGTVSTPPSIAALLTLNKMRHFYQDLEMRGKHSTAFWNKCFGTNEHLWSRQATLISIIQTASTANASITCLLEQMEGKKTQKSVKTHSPLTSLENSASGLFQNICFSKLSPKVKHSFKSIHSWLNKYVS